MSQLIEAALAGEEVIIIQGERPLVKLVAVPEQRRQRRIGGAEGVILFIADDFDAPLEEFEQAML
ncbi:MAG: type II toxin-antitoxin system prevent-host-death family antitoxin [Anaerolineae bacterium]